MNDTDFDTMSPVEMLTYAMYLALVAPNDDQVSDACRIAELITQKFDMQPGDVEQAKADSMAWFVGTS
jgi:hypothetical protein